MTLQEISRQYRADADVFAGRIRYLERRLQQERDLKAARRLQQRIAALRPLLQQSRSMARTTEHYYDRGCRRYDPS